MSASEISQPSAVTPASSGEPDHRFSPCSHPADDHFLPPTHRILERQCMEFRPFGKDFDDEPIRDMYGVSIRSNVEYLEESIARVRGLEAGKETVEQLVRLLNERIPDRAHHVTPPFLKNPWMSYSNEFTAYLVEFCVDLSGDPDFQFNMGREKLIPPLIQTLMRPFSVGQIYRMAAYYAQQYCTNSYRLEGIQVTDRSAVLRMILTDHALRQFGCYRRACARIWCNALKVGISIVPDKIHRLGPATVTDRRCIVKGDDYCEWDVTWATGVRWYPGRRVLTSLGRHILRHELQQRDRVIQEQMLSLESRHGELQKAYTELQQTAVELERRVDHLTTLHQAALTFTSMRDQEGLLQQALEILIHKLHYDRVLITFFDLKRRVTHGGRLFGISDEMAEFARQIEVPITDATSIEGTVILLGQPILVSDTSEILHRLHPMNRELILRTQSESFISVPLKVKDRVLGSLTVDRLQKRCLTEDDLALMITFGNQLAIALDNAAAYREIEELNIGLEARVRERTAELESANETLKQMDRLKSQFLAHVSHELRTPLTSIAGFTDNMLDGLAGRVNDKQQQYLTRIKANGSRLTRMITNLLDLSRIEAGKLELSLDKVPLTEIVSDVVEQIRPIALAKHQRLELYTDPQDLIVWGDADRLSQIMTNLVDNAVKYTPEAGTVVVHVTREGHFAKVSVKDTGIGIPSEALPKLFDPFFRASHHQHSQIKGLGLGLSIVKELVELHGGVICVSSDEGDGTEFHFTIPILRGSDKTSRPAPVDRKRILVVDDDTDIRHLLRDQLQADGYIVQLAVDGREALEVLGRDPVDGVILDIGMPQIDGLEVLRNIRLHELTIPVVMITAVEAREQAFAAMDSGAQACLLKPFTSAQLQQIVDRWFRPELPRSGTGDVQETK